MKEEYVIVKKADDGISYYYTGRDKNPYIKNKTLKEVIEEDSSHIVKNVTVNGITVNKVIGTKTEKRDIRNWVWYSGNLWQVIETTDEYVKLITANSITSIAYGSTSNWEDSWVRKWLNEINGESNQDGIFYHNLSRKDLLLDGNFCLDEPANIGDEEFETVIGDETITRKRVTNFIPINECENISTDKIGIMTFEDYVYSLNGTNGILGASGGSYLDEDEYSWTMTKAAKGGVNNRVWHTYYFDLSHIEHDWGATKDYGKGVRPVIYLSSKIKIEKNNADDYGKLDNPYCLLGEQKLASGDSLNKATVGSYIYLSETNNKYSISKEYVTSRLSYNYDNLNVRYRVIGVSRNGTIKVQRSDVLRGLPSSTIAISGQRYVPYYYIDNGESENSCGHIGEKWYIGGCQEHNFFDPNDGEDDFVYTDGENIGYFLNNADNSYYNWLSDEVKANIVITNWNLPVAAYASDYAESLFNNDTNTSYPTTTNDGIVSAKIGLPQWGDMFSGNDINAGYWLINRWPDNDYRVAFVHIYGYGFREHVAANWMGVRPVFNLKSNLKISGGEGTPKNPYNLSI